MKILQVKIPQDQSRMIDPAKFTYSPLGKALDKQVKTIEDQGEKRIKAIDQHEKQLVESDALIKNMIMILKKIAQHI